MKYIVKCRSLTRRTRVFDRSGWHGSTAWTTWRSVARFADYESAKAFVDAAPAAGLRQYVVFHGGKPYREIRSMTGDLIRVVTGAKAYRP